MRKPTAIGLVALLLGKASVASERGIDLRIGEGTSLPDEHRDTRELVTVVGNLVDNALDSVAPIGHGFVEVTIRAEENGVLVRVRDPETLDKLPREERQAWRDFWDEVDALHYPGAPAARAAQGPRSRTRQPDGASPRRGLCPRRTPGRRRLHGVPRARKRGHRVTAIRTLIVDDDYMSASVHRSYTERLQGFVVVGEAHTGNEALEIVKRTR